MFSKWSSYLFGNVEATDDGIETAAANAEFENVSTVNSNNSVTNHVEDEDWILLEEGSELCDDNDDCLELIDDPEIEELSDDNQNLEITRSSSSCSSIIQSCNLEESWFMTPPPCFTITIANNNGSLKLPSVFNVESNPIENLLIEHPSMSVYKNHHHPYTTTDSRRMNFIYFGNLECKENRKPILEVKHEPDSGHGKSRASKADGQQQQQQQQRQFKDLQAISAMTKANKRNRNYCRKNVVVPPTKLVPNTNHDHQVEIEEIVTEKQLEKFNRLHKQRNNKARNVNSRNNRQRRGERSQGSYRSNISNNRICC